MVRKLAEVMRLLWQLSLAGWPSIFEELSDDGGRVIEYSDSTFTSELMQKIYLGVPRFLKSFLIQCLSCDDLYSHPLGPAEKWRKLNLLKISPLRLCHEILAHVAQKHTLPGLHVDFAKKEKTAELDGLSIRDGPRQMFGGKEHYADDTVFLLVASFIDRNIGFGTNCDLTGINMQYIDIVDKVLVDHTKLRRVEKELRKLLYAIEELRRVV